MALNPNSMQQQNINGMSKQDLLNSKASLQANLADADCQLSWPYLQDVLDAVQARLNQLS
jgi:hypothetical protein